MPRSWRALKNIGAFCPYFFDMGDNCPHIEITKHEGAMPTIKILPGCQIKIYLADHNPPHVHVWAAGMTAKVEIETGAFLTGALDHKARRAVRRWLAANQDFAMEQWRKIAQAK